VDTGVQVQREHYQWIGLCWRSVQRLSADDAIRFIAVLFCSVAFERFARGRVDWKGKEGKSICIAPFIYYVYLKALRHGSHSFTCKYTMSACLSFVHTYIHKSYLYSAYKFNRVTMRLNVYQMAPPLTEVKDIQLQLTTQPSTPNGWKAELAWLVEL